MFDQNYLAQLETGYKATQSAAPQPKENFLEKLLPSIGGVGGGAAGAAIGTALLPGIGTIAGGLLGGALGGGGGKVAENAATHQKLGNGVLGDAALNGVLSAGPLRLGKLGIDAVRGVKAGTGLAGALTNAGTNAANMSLLQSAGDKIANKGENLIAKEFRLTPTQQFNFKNLHGETATSVLRRNGIKTPEDVISAIQPLQDSFNTVIHQIPAISKQDLSAGLAKVYDPLLKSPALFEQGLGTQIKAQANELLKQAKGGHLLASDVNKMRQLFDQAVNYTQRGAPEYNVIKKTADALRGTLQTAADKAGVKVGGQTFKQIGQELNKLHDINDIVGKQAFNGTGSLPLSLPNLLGAGVGTGAIGGPMGALGGFAASQIVNSPLGRRVLANGALKTGEKLATKGAAGADKAFGVIGQAKRVIPGNMLIDSLTNQSLPNNNDTTQMSPTSMNAPTNAAMMPGQYTQNGSLSSGSADNSMFSQQNELAAVLADIEATGGKNINTIQTVFGLAQPPTPTLDATQQKEVSASLAGINRLQQYGQQIDSLTGGASGNVATGALSTFLGKYDPLASSSQKNAAALQTSRRDVAIQIATALMGGNKPSAQSIDEIEQSLPSVSDSAQLRQSKLNAIITGLQQNLQSYAQPVSQVVSGLGYGNVGSASPGNSLDSVLASMSQ